MSFNLEWPLTDFDIDVVGDLESKTRSSHVVLMEFGLEFWLRRRKERQIAYVRRAIGDVAKEEEEYLPPGISHKDPSSQTVEACSEVDFPRTGHRLGTILVFRDFQSDVSLNSFIQAEVPGGQANPACTVEGGYAISACRSE